MAIEIREEQAEKPYGPGTLFELTHAVAAAGRLEDIYDAALTCLRDTLGVSKAAILRFDSDQVMRFKAWMDLSAEYRGAVEGHTPWTPQTLNPQPVLVADVREDASLATFCTAIEAEHILALAFVPMSLGKTLLGKFMLYYPEPHQFSKDEIAIAQTIAAHVSFAIDQQENRQRRDHLDAIFRSSLTGIVEVDLQARLVEANSRFCELVGRTRDELLLMDVGQITHPEDQARSLGSIEALMQGGANYTIEKRYLKPDGSSVWALNSVSALHDGSGALTGAVALVTDISEKKAAEEAAREMGRRYQNLVQALGLAVYTTDAEGYITSYNEAAATLWGRRPELFKDMWCGSWRIFNPDGSNLPLEKCPMAVSLREQRSVRNQELVVERQDGSRANILPYPTPLFYPEGNLVGAVNVLVDITERKRAETELASRNRLTEAITDNMSTGLIMVSKAGSIEYMNPAAELITGYKLQDIQGQNVHATLHHTHRDGSPYNAAACPIALASLTGAYLAKHQDVFVRADGSYYDVLCSVAPMVTGSETLGSILDVRDITVEKQAENALIESEGRLRDAAVMKDQFLGLVSHELRTPITTILGNGLLLERRGDDLQPQDRQQALSDVVSEASKLQEIIENLLLLTRLESGQLELEPVVLADIVREGVAEFSKHHPDRQVTLDCGSRVPVARGHIALIQLVVRNLLSNAHKYSPQATAIDVKLDANEGGSPEVSVRDFGMGLSSGDLAKIFTPFYRAVEARGRAQGMGLGLAVCKRVIEAQSGEIYAIANPDRGAKFVFSLQALTNPVR